jgi:hypothetical protein
MRDLKSSKVIYFKGVLFVLAGVVSAGLLIYEEPSFKVVLLLGIAVWCFCRAYYFAFYVIEKYVDSGYKFSGLWSFLRYLYQNKDERG